MTQLQTKTPTDTWVTAAWDEYIRIIEDPIYEKAKSYYYNGQFRIEMPPVGNPHARDHAFVIGFVGLFVAITNIKLNGADSCTYRKTGYQETQPDASFYIGQNASAIPHDVSIIDLNIYPPPTLVIEIASSSLADDKGEKRLFYEDLDVEEYWIVDVKKAQLIAFAIANGGSQRITESQVWPGLSISFLEEALRRSRSTTHSQVFNWLLGQFQQ